VTANGLPRSEATWGVPLPVDPGDVVVVASAAGRQEYRVTVRVGEGEQTNVDLLPLPLAASSLRLHVPPPSPPSHGSIVRPLGIGVGLAGLASLAVGTYFGARAISQWNQSNAACPGTTCLDSSGVTLADDAKSSARIADVTLAAGVVALAAGVVLYLAGAPITVDTRGTGEAVTVRF
jgi:serine/threonine-protein kinase